MKLPKQWRHWCEKAGLRLYGPADKGSRRASSWFCLKGHGRVWRVNCHGMLQCGDTLAEFDRWALCNVIETERPSSLAQFKVAVRELAHTARHQDAMGWPDGRTRRLVIDYPAFPDKSARYNPFVNGGDPDTIAKLMLSMIPRSTDDALWPSRGGGR